MTKQYEPCEHRRRSGLLGGDPDQPFDTPCPQCEKADRDAHIFIAVLVVVLALFGWWVAS